MRKLRWLAGLTVLTVLTCRSAPALAQTAPASARIDDALQNITVLVRATKVGYATFWDGNKFIQCRRRRDRQLFCEAAGTTMQPSLRSTLTAERINRLGALGWTLDPSFGNYTRTFPAELPTASIARQIEQTLQQAYAADLANLDTSTRWIPDTPCPPRAGPSQNLAGSVNDMPSMRSVAVRGCSYVAKNPVVQTAGSAKELIALYGPVVTAELQRLRINVTRRVFVVFDVGIGYVQCMPETSPPAMLCEAQSSESWPALTAILTPDRIARLRKAGFTDPGRTPNYWKTYQLDQFSDATIAGELLTILHNVYNYTGAATLKVKTE
jgi:hypothetical protein